MDSFRTPLRVLIEKGAVLRGAKGIFKGIRGSFKWIRGSFKGTRGEGEHGAAVS